MLNRKDFDDGNFIILNGTKKIIFDFLKANSNNAYTPEEISKETNLKNVDLSLRQLKKKGFVDEKKPYFIIKTEFIKKDVREVLNSSSPKKLIEDKKI